MWTSLHRHSYTPTCPLTDNMVGLCECASYPGKQEMVITKQGHIGERERESERTKKQKLVKGWYLVQNNRKT